MNFDFGWFLTVPGILITGGVLLLIVALIILIATSGKKNKENQEVVEEASADTNNQNVAEQSVEPAMPEAASEAVAPTEVVPEMDQPQPVDANDSIMNMPEPVVAGAAPEANQMGDVQPIQEAPAFEPQVANVEQPAIEPVAETPVMEQPVQEAPVTETPAFEPQVANVEQPTMEPVAEAPVMEQPAVQPVVEAPVMEQPAAMPEAPVAQPTMEANSVPNIDNGVQPVAEAPAVEVANPEPAVYGGTNPTVSDVNVSAPQAEQPQIYGGANPLENTQSIPISNIVGPNAGQDATQVPAAEPTMVNPQVQPVQQNIQQ